MLHKHGALCARSLIITRVHYAWSRGSQGVVGSKSNEGGVVVPRTSKSRTKEGVDGRKMVGVLKFVYLPFCNHT
eukprot:scaffold28267_cov35-Tisochrysis_lutea.AAC.1